jgi:hypothetical protein
MAGDRRKTTRVHRAFVVRYRRLWAGLQIWSTSTLTDFSCEGASFPAQHTCAAGERLALQLLVPTTPDPLELQARVVWVKTSAHGDILIGVKFDGLTAQLRQALSDATEVFFHEGGWKPAGADRRQFKRLTQPCEVACRRYGAVEDVWHTAQVQNLSAGGMSISGQVVFEVGGLLEVKLPMPTLHGPLALRGRALWGHLQENDLVEHGVEFIDITAEQRLQIDNFVQFLAKNP